MEGDVAGTAAELDAERTRFNLGIEGLSLQEPGATGVVATSISSSAATACATYLEQHWVDGQVRVRVRARLRVRVRVSIIYMITGSMARSG